MQQLTNIQELEKAIDKNGEMVVSKNSKNNVIIMSMEEYKQIIMKEDIIKKLKKSEEEIENGKGIEADVALKKHDLYLYNFLLR